MSKFDLPFDSSRGPEDFNHRRDWLDLFFSGLQAFDAANIHWIPNGPLGNSRLASTRELVSLKEAGQRDNVNYLQLLPAYAIAHNPGAVAVDMGPLALPLGVESPNALVIGRAGSGKTQSVTLPTGIHALRCGWSMVYINVKGAKQTRFLRRVASFYGRSAEIKLISPLKLKRTTACTLLEGCESLSKANEVAEVMVATAARNSRDGDGAWCYNQAQEFLQHGIAAICSDSPKSRRNLNEIRNVVLTGTYQAFAEKHPNFPVLAKFARYVAEGNKNAETVTAAISESTSFIDEIPEFLSKNELSLDTFAHDGGCLIIEIDQADIKRLRPIVTLLLARLISSLQRAANSSPSGCVAHKTVIIIDELIASGAVPGLAEALHTCRELGFSFVAGAQSISQLGTIYGHEAQSVLDGFQTQIAIAGGLDLLTAEHFSRRSGVATIALPGVHEPGDSDGDLTVSRNWQLSSRPILLPSDIASPIPHADLGLPATIIAGDGKTPPFQAYLTPCHQEGALARMQDEVAAQSHDDDLRRSPLTKPRFRRAEKPSTSKASEAKLPAGISNTKGWSDERLRKKIEEVRKTLDWDNTTGSARNWWSAFEDENKMRIALVLRLAEELAIRKATITEFFLAYVYSNTDNIQANLYWLDYSRLKKEEEKKKRMAAEASLAKNKEESLKDDTDFDIFADETSEKGSESKADPVEQTFVRCKSCRSLVPSHSNRCRMCGQSMTPVPVLDFEATTGFEVVLTSPGYRKLNVVKVVKFATGKSLMDSKKLVESAPTTLGRTRTREDATKVVQAIQDAGGQAHIV